MKFTMKVAYDFALGLILFIALIGGSLYLWVPDGGLIVKIEYDVTYWVVEALLSVTPNKPKWSTVNKVAVNGYDSLKENIQSYWEFQFWTDIIAWNKRDSAYKEFGKLISYPQKGQLRLVKVHVIKKTGVIITATMEIK